MKDFSLLARLLRWPAKRPRQSLCISLLITAASVLAVTRFHADTSFENLLPKSDPAATSLVRALNDFSAVDESLVLISLPSAATLDQQQDLVSFAERFESASHQDVAANQLIDSISYRVDDQTRRFFQNVVVPAGLYYLDDDSYAAARKRLTRPQMDLILRQNEAMLAAPGPAAGALAATLLQDPLHLHDFLQRQMTGNQPMQIAANNGLLLSRDGRSLLMRIAGKKPVSDLEYSKTVTAKIRDLLKLAQPGDLQVDLTGGYAIAAASERAIRHDMTSGITGSVVLLQVLFIAAYRRPVQTFLLAFAPVGLGIFWGFGVRAVMDRMLSPTAAVVGGVLAGLGVDYTIQYLSNYQARRAAGAAAGVAAEATSTGMASTLFAAWATSVIGFGVVGFSKIPALRDFALVGSLGLLGVLLATFLVLPALLVLLDRSQPAVQLRFDALPLLRMIARQRRLSFSIVGGILILAAGIVAWPGTNLASESDLTSMHPRPNPPLDAELKISQVMGIAPGSILVYLSAADDVDLIVAAHEVDQQLHSTVARAAGITGSFGLANVLPDPRLATPRQQTANLAAANRIVRDFQESLAASAFQPTSYEPYAEFLRILFSNKHIPSISDLVAYPQLSKSMLSRAEMKPRQPASTNTGLSAHESLTLLFTDRNLDNRAERASVVDAARAAVKNIPSAKVTGLSVVGLDAENTVHNQLPLLLLISSIIVGLFIFLHFRNWIDALLAFSPTLFSLLVLVALGRLSGQSLNIMNLLVIPLLMGIDTDYGIFLVGLTRQAARNTAKVLQHEMAASFYALGISAASAALGFGSLIFTSVPAIRSLGWAMGFGVAICFGATLLFRVPMLLRDESAAARS